MMSSLPAIACGGRSQPQLEPGVAVTPSDPGPVAPAPPVEPPDPFAAIPAIPLTVTSMAGQKVLALHVGSVMLTDSVADRAALREFASAALDSALERANTGVEWIGLAAQRRAVRRNPTLAVNPDRIPLDILADPAVDRVPASVILQMRGMAAVTGARFALAPAVVRIVPTAAGFRATYVIAMVDTRTSTVMARMRAAGTGATPEAALQAAAATVVATSNN